MKVQFFLIFFFLIHGGISIAQTGYVKVIQNLLAQPDYKNAQIGIQISDA
ncbi:MAG: hypothetical protein ACOC10_12545 [Bacteroidota bacterium]